MRSVSDLDLERFLVDDLDDIERTQIAAAIDHDVELQRYVTMRRAAQTRWHSTARPFVLPKTPPTLRQRWASWASSFAAWRAQGLGLAGLAACLALIVVGRGTDVEGDVDVVRSRGGGGVVTVAVQRQGQVFRWQDQPLRAGDAVRIGGVAPGSFVVVVSVDRRGVASLLTEIRGGADGWLPGSLVLDDSEGPEQWLIATSATAFDGARFVAAASSSAAASLSSAASPSALRAAFAQVTLHDFVFEKEPLL